MCKCIRDRSTCGQVHVDTLGNLGIHTNIQHTWPKLEVYPCNGLQSLHHLDVLQLAHVDVNLCDPHGLQSLKHLDVLQLPHVDPSLLWHRTALVLRTVVEETGEDHVVVHLRYYLKDCQI